MFSKIIVGGALFATLFEVAHCTVYLKETFDQGWRDRWVDSTWKGESMGTWEWTAGKFYLDEEEDKGIQTKDRARFYGISRKLEEAFSTEGKDLVVQYAVKWGKKATSFCGGGYIKLLGSDIDQESFGGDTPYSVMFGPDMCGSDVSRIHAIFNYKGENLLKEEDIKLDSGDKDEYSHLFTLHVKPDNTYTVYFDLKEKASGSLTEEWAFPSKEIDDPSDLEPPADWVHEEMMLDPEHVKPEGYDDIPEKIPDPEASQPADWDEEDDGEWEPPMISNPEYKGPFVQRKIKNPDYKGPFKPRQIPNPDYDPNVYMYKDIGSVGFELWVVDHETIFDNIFVGDNLDEAFAFAEESFTKRVEGEKKMKEEQDKAEKEAEAAAAAAKEAEDEEADQEEEDEEEEGEEADGEEEKEL